MDFITGLPKNKAYKGIYNFIFVIINKFSKMAYYILCVNIITIEELIEIFI